MITPPTDSFYVIRAEGDAAELIASTLSMGAMNDIRAVVLLSADFKSDIQATCAMDKAVNTVRSALLSPISLEKIKHNPLYIPSTPQDVDDLMEVTKADRVKFVGMGGNPFIIKSVNLEMDDKLLIEASTNCHPFDLPAYAEIVKLHTDIRLN